MNSIVKETLDKLRQCDDFHNRCDYLLEHSEITYLLEYIELKDNIIKEVREIIEEKCREEVGGIAWYIKNILDKENI